MLRGVMDASELTPIQRASIVTRHLCAGESLTVADVMRLTGLTRRPASRLLLLLCGPGVLPLYCDGGRWKLLTPAEMANP